jgi:hypothetical protein
LSLDEEGVMAYDRRPDGTTLQNQLNRVFNVSANAKMMTARYCHADPQESIGK